MDNLDAAGSVWWSLVLRIVFLIVVACHIPFMFFSGKETLLNMYYEITQRAISKVLEQ